MSKTTLESKIEQDFVDYAESLGCRALKLRIDGQRGFPDRTVLTPVGVLFLEFKRPGGRTHVQQRGWIFRLHEMGFVADIVDNYSDAVDLLHHFIAERTSR
jgi:hypothetical protein